MLGTWSLTNDVQYPWRTDADCSLAPMVLIDQVDAKLPELPHIGVPCGTISPGGTGVLLGTPLPDGYGPFYQAMMPFQPGKQLYFGAWTPRLSTTEQTKGPDYLPIGATYWDNVTSLGADGGVRYQTGAANLVTAQKWAQAKPALPAPDGTAEHGDFAFLTVQQSGCTNAPTFGRELQQLSRTSCKPVVACISPNAADQFPSGITRNLTWPTPSSEGESFWYAQPKLQQIVNGMAVEYNSTAAAPSSWMDWDGCPDCNAHVQVAVDLDIDSDNNNGFGTPARSPAEDVIEDDPALPGKILWVHGGDSDGDGIPDFADGYNLNGIAGDADDSLTNAAFATLVLELPAWLDISSVHLTLTYDASDPAQVEVSGDPVEYTPAPGTLRLWRKNGSEQRNPASALATSSSARGDYLAPGEYSDLTALGFSATTRKVTCYVEAVRVSAAQGDQRISVSISLAGNPSAGSVGEDAVRVTSLYTQIVSRDKFMAGSVEIPSGDDGLEIELVNTTTGENLGRYGSLLGGGSTKIYDAVTDILSDADVAAGLQPDSQQVWFVRNATNPRQVEFYTCFNEVGSAEVKFWLNGVQIGSRQHSLLAAEDFADWITYVDNWVKGVGFEFLDDLPAIPPPMVTLNRSLNAATPMRLSNLSRACLIPIFNVVSRVEGQSAQIVGLFDGVKNGLRDDRDFVHLLLTAVAKTDNWLKERAIAELLKWKEPANRAAQLKQMADKAVETWIFSALPLIGSDLGTWEGFRSQAWKHAKAGGEVWWLITRQSCGDLWCGFSDWFDDFGDRMMQGGEKTAFFSTAWADDPAWGLTSAMNNMIHYELGYTAGYLGEQIVIGLVLSGESIRIAEVLAKGGVRLAGTLSSRTMLILAARSNWLKKELASMALATELRFAVERGLVDAAGKPISLTLRYTPAEIIQRQFAKPGFDQSVFNGKAMMEAATQEGGNLRRLFAISGEEGTFFRETGSFIATMGDEATATASKSWLPVLDRLLKIETGSPLQNRVSDLNVLFKTDTALGRTALREALEDYAGKTAGFNCADYTKLPLLSVSRISELYPSLWRVLNRDASSAFLSRIPANIVELKRTRQLPPRPKPANEIVEVTDRINVHYCTTEKFPTPEATRGPLGIDTAWSDCKVRVKLSTPQLEGNAFVAPNAEDAFGHLYDPLSRGHPIDDVTELPLPGGSPQIGVYGAPIIDEIEVWDDATATWIRDVWDEVTETWVREP